LDDTVNPNQPAEIGIATTPVDAVDLSTDGELQAFVAGGVTYSQEELIQPTLTSFVGHSGSSNFFTTQTGDVLPESGARAALLTDLRLDTGVVNLAAGSQAATLQFAEPLVNGPGPDLIVFELASTIPFQVALDETVGVVLDTSWGDEVARADFTQWSATNGPPTNIDELEDGRFEHNGDFSDSGIVGVVIDLNELGVAPLDEVTTLHFGSFWLDSAFDPVLILGIDSAPNLPGDYNNNGQVEQGDLNLVLLNWGSDVVPNGWVTDLPTGAIDQEELNKVLLGWGNTAPVAAAAGAVPEPTTLLMGLVVVTGVLLCGLAGSNQLTFRPRRID